MRERPLVPGGVLRVVICPRCDTPIASTARTKVHCRECGYVFVPTDDEEDEDS